MSEIVVHATTKIPVQMLALETAHIISVIILKTNYKDK